MKDLKDRRGYKNVFDALSRVLREEGFGKLYSGLAPGILRGMSMNVGQMACFDQVSRWRKRRKRRERERKNKKERKRKRERYIYMCLICF